jgi:hypothetical protein
MKLHPGLVVLPLAGLLVVVGAGAVLATADRNEPTSAVTAAASPTPDPSAAAAPGTKRTDTALQDALDGLVADGTITTDQKTKILAAIAAERTARREQMQADRQVLKDALADGEITQAELDKLSPDHWLRQATDLMADGKITADELHGLGRGMMRGMGGRHGQGMGGGGWWKAAPTASPAPTSGTSG